jgi:CubicO group peptidase (beta-lactamase class C family)
MTRMQVLPLVLALGSFGVGCGREPAAVQAPPPDAQGPNTDVNQLRSILRAESAKAGTQAVVFGMWVGETEILTEALGNASPGVPATTAMHYRIGGITETFLSTVLLLLSEQGQINLDDKISRWFPDLLSADQVTVRMLAANTAGYPDYVHEKAWVDRLLSDPFKTFTDDELIGYALADKKMKYAPPGSSQAYSHTEYVILGQIMQRQTGKSMKELYEQYVLGPLGLKDTQLPTDATIQAPVLHSYMSDRGTYEDASGWTPSWALSYGGLTSNVHDLGKWGPAFGKGTLVSPASHKEITGPGSVGKGGNRADLYFGYGFIVTNGWYLQNPDINGYAGAFAYNPTNNVTLVAVSTKTEKPVTDPAALPILREIVKYVTPATPLNF